MRLRIFKEISDANNYFDPYPDKVKRTAELTPHKVKFLTNKPALIGDSTKHNTNNEQVDTHHILPRMLFPLQSKKGFPNNTPTIKVTQSKHRELHELLAQCKFCEYVNLLQVEDSNIPRSIVKALYRRIRELPMI